MNRLERTLQSEISVNLSVHSFSFQMGCSSSRPVSYIVGNKRDPFAIRRHPDYPDGPMKNPKDCQTMQDVALNYFKKHAKNNYLGVRPMKSNVYEPRYEFCTYEQGKETADKLGVALAANGIVNKSIFGIYMENNPAWLNSMDASCLFGFVIVSLYDSLGPDAVEYLISHSKMEAILVSEKNYKNLMSVLKKNQYNVRFVIVNEDKLPDDSHSQAVKLYTYKQFLEEFAKDDPLYPKIDPEQAHFISYSSGTTGSPKGVIVSHRAAVSATLAATMALNVRTTNGIRHISYLPLAHVFERVAVSFTCNIGGAIGFNMGGPANLLDDISVLKPSYLPAVPRVMNRIYDGIQEKLKESSVKRAVFKVCWNCKKFCLKSGITPCLFDAICFNQIKAKFGGCVDQIVVGAAALDPSIQEFLQVCTGIPIRVGYGLTEACAANIIVPKPLGRIRYGTVGGPLPNCQVKLEKIDGYDDPDAGEIWLSGQCLCSGYLYEEQITNELFTDETRKWIRTGDVGKYDADGYLRIIDRMRSIFKLSQGEYVAADILTQVYDKCRSVEQTFVYGDSQRTYLVAIVVPRQKDLLAVCNKSGLTGNDYLEFLRSKEAKDAILKQFKEAAEEARFFGYQKIVKVHLEAEPWTVENDCLTPTFKLKRKFLENKYKGVIEALYNSK